MSKGINLLGNKKQVISTPAARRLKLMRFVAVVLLFGISVASVILFLLISLSPLPALQQQEQNARATLAKSHPDIVKLFLVSDRLKGSAEIIKKRPDYAHGLEIVAGQMPDDLRISGLSLSERTLGVTIEARSLLSIDTFLNNLVTLVKDKKEFAHVSLTDFHTDEEKGIFIVTVSVVML